MYPVKKTKLRNMHKVLGCALSHYTCIKSAKLLGYKNVLILEDDTCFIKDILLLKEYLNNLPADWDYIKYSLCHSDYRNITALYKTVNNINENYFLINKELPAWFSSNCSGAYALNEKTMDYYINTFENSKLTPADKIQYMNYDGNATSPYLSTGKVEKYHGEYSDKECFLVKNVGRIAVSSNVAIASIEHITTELTAEQTISFP